MMMMIEETIWGGFVVFKNIELLGEGGNKNSMGFSLQIIVKLSMFFWGWWVL